MKVGEIVYKILGDDSGLAKTLSGVGGTASKALGLAAKAAAALGTAITAAAGATAKLAKAAVDGYADFEQLVGGVETLFGAGGQSIEDYAKSVGKSIDEVKAEYDSLISAQNAVMDSAAKAFRTAGLSQNEYMETVTGFSAALISSLAGDTEKAAEIADMAIIDMADNANKMGSSMESIQNAYQGFAKQNYTMLDNLKLGYGGTKEEMERLLEDAEKLTGIDYDLSSYADIVQAIHAIQDEMGISGTTAKEAAETISGSIASMRAAWDNLVVGLADDTQDFGVLLDNFIDTFTVALNNFAPRVKTSLSGISRAIGEIVPIISEQFPVIAEDLIPSLIGSARSLVEALLAALPELVQTIVPELLNAVDDLIDTLSGMLPQLLGTLGDVASDIITVLLEAIVGALPAVADGAVAIILALIHGISDNLPLLIPAAVEAVLIIAEGLLQSLPTILEAARDLIAAFAEGLANSIPIIVERAPELIESLAAALLEGIPTIILAAEEIVEAFIGVFLDIDWQDIGRQMYRKSHGITEAVEASAESFEEATRKYNESMDKFRSTQNELISVLNEISEIEAAGEGTSTNQRYMELLSKADELSEASAEYLAAATEYQAIAEEFTKGLPETFSEEAAKRAEEEAKRHFESLGAAVGEGAEDGSAAMLSGAENLESALEKLDHLYKTHRISEAEYYAQRKAALERHRDDESEDWWKYYDDVVDYYDKLAETEKSASEKAAKESEYALKNSVADKFRDLETEQLEKGYDDSWLLEQERAFVETLDHNSAVYKDYNLKLLQAQKKTDELAAKEAENAAKKQQTALQKAYESVIKTRDNLAKSLSSAGDIFSSSESTDKRTGEKSKSRSVNIDELEKKITAKRQLTSKIAELLEKNTPDDIITELLKADPEDALYYANDLLKNPSKLSRLKSGLEKDEAYSSIIANMVTEHSDEFSDLGTDVGNLFGESFTEAFCENWEEAFKSVFSDEYAANVSASVTSANAAAASESTYVRRDHSADNSSNIISANKNPAFNARRAEETVRIVDVNGNYVAKVARAAQNEENTRGGG